MFARFTRLPLRRCIHTNTVRPKSFRLTRTVLGASAVTATYLAWRSLSEPIALDSSTPTQSTQKPLKSQKLSEASLSSSSDSIPESMSIPDSEFSPEQPPVTEFVKEDDPAVPSTSSENEPKDEEEPSTSSDEPASGGGGGGAFNPETGEINWDCPCLGGMAHGPCGPEFREAFSCFVFSEQEPKGIDCVEKFQAMQNCFRAHPEIYADEIMDDDDEEGTSTPEAAPVTESDPSEESASSVTPTPASPETPSIPS